MPVFVNKALVYVRFTNFTFSSCCTNTESKRFLFAAIHTHLARAASKQIKLVSRAKMPLSFTEVDTALRIFWLSNVKELIRLVGLQVC